METNVRRGDDPLVDRLVREHRSGRTPDLRVEAITDLESLARVEVMELRFVHDGTQRNFRPMLSLAGRLRGIGVAPGSLGNYAPGVTGMTFTDEDAPAVHGTYHFTNEQLADLVTKGYFEGGLEPPEDLLSNWDVPVRCNVVVVAPRGPFEPSLLFVQMLGGTHLQVDLASTGYELEKAFEPLPSLGLDRSPVFEAQRDADRAIECGADLSTQYVPPTEIQEHLVHDMFADRALPDSARARELDAEEAAVIEPTFDPFTNPEPLASEVLLEEADRARGRHAIPSEEYAPDEIYELMVGDPIAAASQGRLGSALEQEVLEADTVTERDLLVNAAEVVAAVAVEVADVALEVPAPEATGVSESEVEDMFADQGAPSLFPEEEDQEDAARTPVEVLVPDEPVYVDLEETLVVSEPVVSPEVRQERISEAVSELEALEALEADLTKTVRPSERAVGSRAGSERANEVEGPSL